MSLHITILVGAARPGNRTTIVAREAASRLERLGATVDLVALGDLAGQLTRDGDRRAMQQLCADLVAAVALRRRAPAAA